MPSLPFPKEKITRIIFFLFFFLLKIRETGHEVISGGVRVCGVMIGRVCHGICDTYHFARMDKPLTRMPYLSSNTELTFGLMHKILLLYIVW